MVYKNNYVYLNVPCRKSERETLVCGKGTVPGSEHIALKCDTVNSKRNVLKITMWNGAHKLKNIKNIIIYKQIVILYK